MPLRENNMHRFIKHLLAVISAFTAQRQQARLH